MKQELFTPLRTYESKDRQNRYQYFYESRAIRYSLYAPKTQFLSICFLREPSSNLLTSVQVLSASDDTPVFELSDTSVIASYFDIFQLRDSSGTLTDDIIFYKGDTIAGMSLNPGAYYIKMSDSVNEWYTEVFCVAVDTCNYIRLRWWNCKDIGYFPYSQGFWHTMYLDSHLIEGEDLVIEEGTENGQKSFVPSLQRSVKQYSMPTDTVPPFVKDAISGIWQCDNVYLSKPDLPIHIDGANLLDFKMEEGDGWVTKMNYSGLFKFRVDATIKTASQENLNLNRLIAIEFSYSLSTGFSDQFDACNNEGTPAVSTFYSEDNPLIVSSLLYTQSGNAGSPAPSGWYRDATNGQAISINGSGIVDSFFTCLTEYEFRAVTGAVSESGACGLYAPVVTLYTNTPTLQAGSIVYTVSQDITSTISDQWLLNVDTDRPTEITGGAGVVASVSNQCVQFAFASVIGPFADSGTACSATTPTGIIYSRTSPLSVGVRVYSTSHDVSSSLVQGWHKDDSTIIGGEAIEVDASGFITSDIDCNDKYASYVFTDNTVFDRDNICQCLIDTVNYSESDNPSINIGSNGIESQASYVISSGDESNLAGEELVLSLTLYNGTSNLDPVLSTDEASAASGTVTTANLSANDGQITSGSVYVELIVFQRPV